MLGVDLQTQATGGEYVKQAMPLILIALGLVLAFAPVPSVLPLPIFDDADPTKTEGSWVVVIEETEDRTPEVAKVLTNDKFWAGLESRGLRYRIMDVSTDEARPYRALSDKLGIPCVLVIAVPDGTVLAEEKLPGTLDGLDAIVSKATGR